jgi:hypothetical protein
MNTEKAADCSVAVRLPSPKRVGVLLIPTTEARRN